MTRGRSVKQLSFISYFLFIINCQQSLSAALFRIHELSLLYLLLISWYTVKVGDDLHKEDRGDMMYVVFYIEERGETMMMMVVVPTQVLNSRTK